MPYTTTTGVTLTGLGLIASDAESASCKTICVKVSDKTGKKGYKLNPNKEQYVQKKECLGGPDLGSLKGALANKL